MEVRWRREISIRRRFSHFRTVCARASFRRPMCIVEELFHLKLNYQRIFKHEQDDRKGSVGSGAQRECVVGVMLEKEKLRATDFITCQPRCGSAGALCSFQRELLPQKTRHALCSVPSSPRLIPPINFYPTCEKDAVLYLPSTVMHIPAPSLV